MVPAVTAPCLGISSHIEGLNQRRHHNVGCRIGRRQALRSTRYNRIALPRVAPLLTRNSAVANMRLQEDTSHMRDANVRLQGRILYLTEDPGFVRAQLAGNDPAWTPDNKLRDDISTDEITPAYICYYYDETLGEFPYLGLKCRDEFPIAR